MTAEARPSTAGLNTHARAVVACLITACLLVVLPGSATSHAAGGKNFDRVERKIIRKINAIRSGSGLHRVKGDRALSRSADFHCRDMLGANFFAHTSSNGWSFEQRVERFRPSRRIGETLAYLPKGTGGGMAGRIVTMWMNSPPHRASLLSPSFRRIGVARRNGRLGGQPVTVFTADFTSKR